MKPKPNPLMADLLMANATRLTGSGNLMEATAAIQRALGSGGHQGGPPLPSRRDSPGEHAESPGHFSDGTYADGSDKRHYKLFVPAGFAGQRLPLVVMLHGCTQDPDDFATGTRMNVLAQEQGMVVLYPAQPARSNMQKCWNWFQPGDQRRGAGEPALLAGMTRHIIATQSVDTHRVYVAGLSAGGAMAAILGSEYPDLFAAVGVHSGLAQGSAHDMPSAFAAMQGNAAATAPRPAGSPPTIVFHGDQDATVHPVNGEQVIRDMRAATASAATASELAGGEGRRYRRTIHRNAAGRAVGELWQVHGAGHAWFGGDPAGSYTDPQGPDASREMLRFFREHSRGLN